MERSLLRETWAELRRRRVVRAGITYAVVGWIVLQAAEITFEPLNLPPWALTWTVLGVVLGFPVALVLSWFFDVSSRGVTRERGVTGPAGAAFAVAMVLLAVGGIAWWLYGVYAPAKLRLATADTSGEAIASAAPHNSVGVLPFDDLSPGADQGYLADGIAEELLDRLARNSGLQVASRTSSFALRGLAKDMRALGQQLGVRWLLEGSLRKANGRVRVTAQLIDTSSGFHVWSDTYEKPDQDLFALQDEIATSISGELSSRIEGVAAEAPTEADTRNAEALQAYMKGREAWRKRTAASLELAETMFLEAVDLDPEFARAWSGLADTYLLQADYGRRSDEEAIRMAEPAAVKAVVLGPRLGEAWASVGLLRMAAGQYKAAQSSLEQAMSLDPRYEMAAMWLATVYANTGRVDKQREVLLKAAELNPLEPVINVNLADLKFGEGDARGALEVLQRVLAVTPEDAALLRAVSGIELARGNYAAALGAANSALKTDPEGPANILTMLRVLMMFEDFDAANQLAMRLPASTQDRNISLQTIEFQRGSVELLPAMAAMIAEIERQPYSVSNSQALTLAGIVALRAGNAGLAAEWLGQAAGEPDQLETNFDRMDPASLLVVAYEAIGEKQQAERWSEPLLKVAEQAIAHSGMGVRRHMLEAMVAAMRNEKAAAVAALQSAYEAGYRDRWQLLYDPRLALLRDTPEVRTMQQAMDREFQAARAEISGRLPD